MMKTPWLTHSKPVAVFRIETSRLFCSEKQMIGFYMKRKTGLKFVNCNEFSYTISIPAGFYMFKVNNRNTRKKCFEHISHLVLVFLLLTLSR